MWGQNIFAIYLGFVFCDKNNDQERILLSFNQTSMYQIQSDLRRKKLVMQDRSPLKYAKKLKAYKICQIFSPNNSGWIVVAFL